LSLLATASPQVTTMHTGIDIMSAKCWKLALSGQTARWGK